MSALSLPAARRLFPALDALYRDDSTALRKATPIVDGVRAVRSPRIRTLEHGGRRSDRPQRDLSPLVHFHPQLSAGLDRVRDVPLRFDLIGLGGVGRIYGNVGRRPMQLGATSGIDVDEQLRAEERRRTGITFADQGQLDAEHEREFDLGEYGGQPTQAVVFHVAEWTDSDGATPACPIFGAWSLQRIVRLITLASRTCHWCNGFSSKPLDDYMLVSCGALLRVFPTCTSCGGQLEHDTDYRGLDWHVRSDDWFASVSYPSDEYI